MRHMLIAAVCTLLFSSNAYSGDINKDELKAIIDCNSADQVKQKLGKPDITSYKNEMVMWNYEKDGYRLNYVWNKNTQETDHLTVLYIDYRTSDWNSRYEQKIQTGTTTLNDVIDLLGIPKDLKVNKDMQESRYVYNDAYISLTFKNKKLTGYQVRTKELSSR